MKLGFKSGTLFLPLLFVLSLSGLFLVKTITVKSFEGYQEEVSANFDKKYDLSSTKYALSNFIGTPDTWKEYGNKDFGYTFKYSQPWNIDPTLNRDSERSQIQITFADKIKLLIVAKKDANIPSSANKLKINDVDFYMLDDTITDKVALAKHNKFYYEISFKQNNFFASNTDFRSTFYQILRNFKFLD